MFDEPIESSNFRDRDLRAIDISQFNIDANDVDWNAVIDNNDLDQQVEKLNGIILYLFDKHASVKSSRKSKKRSKPYITHTIREMIALKNEAHRHYMKTKKFEHEEYYIDLKNYMTFAIL
ncbi:hypothetical protein HHI36_005874 [Cryptolaemus montrouzieri]|uniref:Uncharacterized protein n=1 Tax=Cryptolaemus montrouzieri TaxID=559131 RepID=A0ABD2NVQ4_9CUCU